MAAVLALVLTFLLHSVRAQNSTQQDPSLRLVSKLLDDCSSSEFSSCLQAKAVAFFDRAARTQSIPLWESVSLAKSTEDGPRASRAITEEEISEAKSKGKLADLLWEGVAQFMNTHTLKIDLPKMTSEELRKSAEEGRGKMKKMMSMMMMAGAMKMAAFVPATLGLLFLIAGKAFIISKLALVLTLIIMVKKLLMGQGEELHHAVYSAGGGGGLGHYGAGHYGGVGATWDRRSANSAAQRLAYRLQKP